MALRVAGETLALRWAELCNDPTLHDLPFKIELNARGTMEISPRTTRQGRFRAAVAHRLASQLPHGTGLCGPAIATDQGVRCPDVAWASPDFVARHGDATPFPHAPEICVEVLSPSNTEAEMEMKTAAYLAAGAVEVWIVAVDGSRQVHDATGPRPDSRYGVTLALS